MLQEYTFTHQSITFCTVAFLNGIQLLILIKTKIDMNNEIKQMIPKRELLVLNDMVQGFQRSMVDYQSQMNRADQSIEIQKTTEQYSTVTLYNFNDNDLMLYGFFFYRTMINTAPILIS